MSFVTLDWVKRGVVGCGLLAVSLGCATTGQQKASSAATSLQQTRKDIANCNGALDKAVASLADIAQRPQSDLKPQFDTFKASVVALDAQSKTVAASAQAMQARGEEYFKSWEQELAGINNPELRQISADRRAKLSDHYQKVTEGYEKAKAAFDPLMVQLSDVQKILGLDLTDNGVKMASGSAIEAKASAETVKKELNGVNAELDELSKLLSGTPPAGSK